MPDADLHFYFDPVCPFAWMTSKWVRLVMAERDYTVDWRFISLRQVNAEVDYDSHFPPSTRRATPRACAFFASRQRRARGAGVSASARCTP
jgi:predicted DsbA family dithiol-disulfide isomerase